MNNVSEIYLRLLAFGSGFLLSSLTPQALYVLRMFFVLHVIDYVRDQSQDIGHMPIFWVISCRNSAIWSVSCTADAGNILLWQTCLVPEKHDTFVREQSNHRSLTLLPGYDLFLLQKLVLLMIIIVCNLVFFICIFQAILDSSQHSISFTLSRNQAIIVEYMPDNETDMFQVRIAHNVFLFLCN